LALAVGAAAGCGGGGGSGADAGGADAGGADASDGGPEAPPDASLSRRLIAGRARLVGTHTTACSQGASADHWCAFTLPGGVLGSTELWVIDTEKALSGTVACDGSDTSCLRLTTTLWTGAPTSGVQHPFAHHFYGQTLIFYSGAVMGDFFSGPILAWRPGWAAPRLLAAQASSCDGHPASDVALCVENEQIQAAIANPHFDLHAGRIGTDPLPLAATIYVSTVTNASQWSVAFSPAGDYLAYSTGGVVMTDPETLYVVKVDDVAAPEKHVTVGKGLSQWDISPDGKRWYYLRDYNYPPRRPPPGTTPLDPSGTLATADFPAGGNEVSLAPQVGSYVLLGDSTVDRGVSFLDQITAGRGNYKIIPDLTKPTIVNTVTTGLLSAIASPDARFSYLQTSYDDVNQVGNALVIKNDGTGMCVLAAGNTSDLYGSPFLASAGQIFWADNIDPVTASAQGWRANPAGCAGKQKFADDLDFWFPVGDRGLIYSDAYTPTGVTLRAAKLGASAEWPQAGATTVRVGVGRIFAILEPARQYLVYEISSGGADDGLWVYGPIGFGQP
jgi:hypothetical protein